MRESPVSNDRIEVNRIEGDVTTKTKVKSDSAARGTRLPRPFEMPREWIDWAIGVEGMSEEQAIRESLKFRDHFHSTTKNATKADWFATWRNWCRKPL